MDENDEPGWHWRNCRNITLNVMVTVMDWRFGAGVLADVYQWEAFCRIGPLGFRIEADTGNCSREHFPYGLSDAEAYDNALRWEGRHDG